MSLTSADIAEIMRLIEASSFDELSLEANGMKLVLRRSGGGPAAVEAAPAPAASSPIANAQVPAAQAAVAPAPVATGGARAGAGEAVIAPLLGTFYRAPKPGAPPFVEVGATVQADTVIGIIEVMKLMNTVRAGVAGRVTEILASDGALVEYGEVLLRVELAG